MNRQSTPALALSRPTQVRYLVLAALCAAAVLAYVTRNCLAVPRQTIQRELALTDSDMGYILSAFFLGYALCQIPGGWLGDRWGTRLILPLFVALWSIACALRALAGDFVTLYLLEVTIGAAQACIFPCCVKTFSYWFSPSERSFPNGVLGSFMSVGGAVEKFLTGVLLAWLAWQGVVLIYAVPGLLFAVWFYWWFRDRPEEHPAVNAEERRLIEGADGKPPSAADRAKDAAPLAPIPWSDFGTSGRMALICAQQFFRAAAYVFYATRFPTFLQEAFSVDAEESGPLAAIALLGVVFGSMTGGLVMDYLWARTGSRNLSRKGVALAGTLGAAGFLLLAHSMPDLITMLLLLTLASFCGGATGPAGYTISIDQGGRYVATVFSIMNMAGNIGGFLLPIVLDRFVGWTSWQHALLFIAALYAAAAVCWLLLPVHGRVYRETAT